MFSFKCVFLFPLILVIVTVIIYIREKYDYGVFFPTMRTSSTSNELNNQILIPTLNTNGTIDHMFIIINRETGRLFIRKRVINSYIYARFVGPTVFALKFFVITQDQFHNKPSFNFRLQTEIYELSPDSEYPEYMAADFYFPLPGMYSLSIITTLMSRKQVFSAIGIIPYIEQQEVDPNFRLSVREARLRKNYRQSYPEVFFQLNPQDQEYLNNDTLQAKYFEHEWNISYFLANQQIKIPSVTDFAHRVEIKRGNRKICFIGDSHMRALYNDFIGRIDLNAVSNLAKKEVAVSDIFEYYQQHWTDGIAGYVPELIRTESCLAILANVGQWILSYQTSNQVYERYEHDLIQVFDRYNQTLDAQPSSTPPFIWVGTDPASTQGTYSHGGDYRHLSFMEVWSRRITALAKTYRVLTTDNFILLSAVQEYTTDSCHPRSPTLFPVIDLIMAQLFEKI